MGERVKYDVTTVLMCLSDEECRNRDLVVIEDGWKIVNIVGAPLKKLTSTNYRVKSQLVKL